MLHMCRDSSQQNSNMERIIFLDIDGVLASYQYLTTHLGCHIDPETVKKLNQFDEYGVKVVISSSWGYDNGRTEKTLRECGLTLPIMGYTEHFYVDYLCRGNEIEKFLVDTFGGMATKFGGKYQNKGYEYVIIDDDCDMLYGQKDNFIQIDRETGLTDNDIEQIKTILGL